MCITFILRDFYIETSLKDNTRNCSVLRQLRRSCEWKIDFRRIKRRARRSGAQGVVSSRRIGRSVGHPAASGSRRRSALAERLKRWNVDVGRKSARRRRLYEPTMSWKCATSRRERNGREDGVFRDSHSIKTRTFTSGSERPRAGDRASATPPSPTGCEKGRLCVSRVPYEVSENGYDRRGRGTRADPGDVYEALCLQMITRFRCPVCFGQFTFAASPRPARGKDAAGVSSHLNYVCNLG